MKKTIFLTNDDGYFSYGLLALRDALADIARVVVVAPANEKSACGHGLCVNKPLQLIEIEKDFYKLDDGTPTDCVYIGIFELFQKAKPSLLISGINIGANMGEDITYSGTVAGAIEGALQGIPSIAVSQCISDKHGEENKTIARDFSLAVSFIKQFAQDILQGKCNIGHRKLYNINVPSIPKDACKGIKPTQLGYRIFSPSATKIESPRKKEYHWIGLNPMRWQARDNTQNPYIQNDSYINAEKESVLSDFDAIKKNYISVTPLQLDMTDYADMGALSHYIATQNKE